MEASRTLVTDSRRPNIDMPLWGPYLKERKELLEDRRISTFFDLVSKRRTQLPCHWNKFAGVTALDSLKINTWQRYCRWFYRGFQLIIFAGFAAPLDASVPRL